MARHMDEKTVYRFRKGEDGRFRSYLVPDGSQDGQGAGDHDLPFGGFEARQFSLRQMARLLIVRGRLQDARLDDDAEADGLKLGR